MGVEVFGLGVAHGAGAEADDVAARVAYGDGDAVGEHVAPSIVVAFDDETGLDDGLAVGSDGF